LDEVLRVADRVLGLLEAAHAKGIFHRDIKPDNIFLTADCGVKVLDFGVAAVRDEAFQGASITQSGATLGTPAFMAPEQVPVPPLGRSALRCFSACPVGVSRRMRSLRRKRFFLPLLSDPRRSRDSAPIWAPSARSSTAPWHWLRLIAGRALERCDWPYRIR